MKTRTTSHHGCGITAMLALAGAAVFSADALGATMLVDVPGTSNIWLAGMPAGSTASQFAGRPADTAPNQSPVLVDLSVSYGDVFNFAAVGGVLNHPGNALMGPDGGALTWHRTGDENGIADLRAPINSLIGVFLGDDRPDLFGAPAALNFSPPHSREYEDLHPDLRQPFFIGSGENSGGSLRSITAPAGASRLYLGTMDGYEWSNNVGSFSVEVSQFSLAQSIPAPGAAALSLIALGLAGSRRTR